MQTNHPLSVGPMASERAGEARRSLALPRDKHWRFACNRLFFFSSGFPMEREKKMRGSGLGLSPPPAHLQHDKELILTPEQGGGREGEREVQNT